MPLPSEDALRVIEAALTNQNHQFAVFVETFNQLPPDTRFDISPAVLDAIEATSSIQPTQPPATPFGALRV